MSESKPSKNCVLSQLVLLCVCVCCVCVCVDLSNQLVVDFLALAVALKE